MRYLISCAILLVLVSRPGAPSQVQAECRPESSLITTGDGRTFEGRKIGARRGVLIFETAFGIREVALDAIVGERDAAELRARYEGELNKTNGKNLAAHEKLARRCLAWGLSSGLAEQLNQLLEKDPDNSWAWKTLAQIAPLHRVTEKNPQPEGKGRWDRTQVDLSYRALADGDWVKGAIVRLQLDALPLAAQINEAVQNAERGRELQRWVAVQTLHRAEPVRRVKTLYKTVLGDDCWQVRLMALRSLQKNEDGSTYRPFVRAMLKQGNNDAIRMNAAWALGRLGDKRAVAPLVRALKATGDLRSPHSNISNLTQIAYVKDYDVEVAQTAFIADPVVDVVIDGFVLDVAVVSIQRQREIYSTALNRLTAAKLPASVKAWTDWWETKGGSFASVPK